MVHRLNVRQQRQHIKFGTDWSNRCRDMAVYQFFKMAAVRHLGISKVANLNCQYSLGAILHHPAKFYADWSNCCGDMAVFRMCGMC